MISVAVPLSVGAAAVWYGRHVWLKNQVQRRLVGEARRTNERKATRRPFARKHPVLPWIIACLSLSILVMGLSCPVKVAVAISIVIGLLVVQIDVWIVEVRRARIESQLADTIDVLIATVKAGASLQVALEAAATDTKAPLRPELEEMVARLRLGDAPADAFNLLRQRVPVETFRLFSTTLTVNWEVGGALAETLSSVGRTIRDRLATTRQIRTLSTQGRLTSMSVLAVTYFLGAMMLQAEPNRVMNFLTSAVGEWLVTVALVLQGVGIALVSRMSRPRV